MKHRSRLLNFSPLTLSSDLNHCSPVHPAIIVRQRKPWRRRDGIFLYFEDNAGVIVNPKGEMKGSAIAGPVAKECAGEFLPSAHVVIHSAELHCVLQIFGRVSPPTLERLCDLYLDAHLLIILYRLLHFCSVPSAPLFVPTRPMTRVPWSI